MFVRKDSIHRQRCTKCRRHTFVFNSHENEEVLIPRDPKRIDRMIELLREAWRLFPDERLTQLVINITDTNHDCGPVYYMEDVELERRLQDWVVARQKFLNKREHND